MMTHAKYYRRIDIAFPLILCRNATNAIMSQHQFHLYISSFETGPENRSQWLPVLVVGVILTLSSRGLILDVRI